MEAKPRIIIVAPVFNEIDCLPEFCSRIEKVMNAQPCEYQILFVDDGSTDGSSNWLLEREKTDPQVKVLLLSRNFGHQIAITAGLDHADGDAVIILDSDLQDTPETIPDLLAKWREGYDVVYAVRRTRQGETWMKKFLAATFYKIFRAVVKFDAPLNTGDFRLLDRCVVDAVKGMRETHRFMRGLTCWVGFRQGAVLYDRDPRYAGHTKYPIWKSARLAFDGITSFSAAPLRWTMGFGFLICLLAGAWVLHIMFVVYQGKADLVQGWASIIATVIFMGGVQLICIGILGQYLGRTFEETKHRPLYFLRSKNRGDVSKGTMT